MCKGRFGKGFRTTKLRVRAVTGYVARTAAILTCRILETVTSSYNLRSQGRFDFVEEIGMMPAGTGGGRHAEDHDPNKHLGQSIDKSGAENATFGGDETHVTVQTGISA